jgi:hypothetical protein
MTTLSPSQAFHRIPCGRGQETTMGAQLEQGKLEPLIWQLKSNTDFHLQAHSTQREIPVHAQDAQIKSEKKCAMPVTE